MVKITLLGQIFNKLNRNHFKTIVEKYEGDKHSKGINSWTHLVCMLFLHLARLTSLREGSRDTDLDSNDYNAYIEIFKVYFKA
jgi:hypothetical protein